MVEELPAAGGLVDGEGGAFAVEYAFGVLRDVFGEEERVVLPLGLFVDPETPVVVGNEGAVFGVGISAFAVGWAEAGFSFAARVAAVADWRKVWRLSFCWVMVGRILA
jgi:hypothetical protein